MGSGKTTTALFLAQNLEIPFFDLDQYIVQKEGVSIDSIFKQCGEAYFRKLEYKWLKEILESNSAPIIVALGGGAFCQNDIKLLCQQNTTNIIYLKTEVNTVLKRLKYDINTIRPLHVNDQDIKELYEKRIIKYEEANIHIVCNEKKPPEIGGLIINAIH